MNSAISLFLIGAVLFFDFCQKSDQKQNIVASVGDTTLSLDEILEDIPESVRHNLTSSILQQYVARWVNSQVLYREALKLDLHKRTDLNKEFEKLRHELLVGKFVELAFDKDVPVSEQEITTYFEANAGAFQFPKDKVHAYHICVGSKKEANSVRARLKRGETFQDIVASLVADSLSLEDWDLGYLSEDEIMNPNISKAAFSLPKGQYSYPIESESGFHVIKLVDKRKKGETMDLEMVRDEIRLKLQEQNRQESYHRFLLQAKSNFKIKTNLQLLDSLVLDSLVREGG